MHAKIRVYQILHINSPGVYYTLTLHYKLMIYIFILFYSFSIPFFPSIHPFSSDYPTQGHSCHRVRSQSAMDKLQICHRANTQKENHSHTHSLRNHQLTLNICLWTVGETEITWRELTQKCV